MLASQVARSAVHRWRCTSHTVSRFTLDALPPKLKLSKHFDRVSKPLRKRGPPAQCPHSSGLFALVIPDSSRPRCFPEPSAFMWRRQQRARAQREPRRGRHQRRGPGQRRLRSSTGSSGCRRRVPAPVRVFGVWGLGFGVDECRHLCECFAV